MNKNKLISALFYISDTVAGISCFLLCLAALAGPIVNPIYQRMNGVDEKGLLFELTTSSILLSLAISLYFIRQRKINALLYFSITFIILVTLGMLSIILAASILTILWLPTTMAFLNIKHKNIAESNNV